MRPPALAAVGLLAVLCAAGCASSPPPEATPTPTPCAEPPQLEEAVDIVMAARDDPAAATVWGEEGGRGNNLLAQLTRDDLAAMENPKGRGALVSVVYAGDGAFARSTAHRTGWLVIDEELYPINVEAAAAFKLLWDGYPPAVMTAAGLTDDDYFDFTAYGLDEFVSYNADTAADYSAFLVAANERCETVSGLG